MLEEGCDEVAEESLTVRGAAPEMAVFLEAAGHAVVFRGRFGGGLDGELCVTE